MNKEAPASNATESATCAPTNTLRKRCWRRLPLLAATTFLQSIDQIGARSLPGGINSHRQPGKERKQQA